MAYAIYRRDKKRVYVYYIDPNTGKQVQVPRKDTAHLDGKPVDAVDAWVDRWEKDHGMISNRIRRENLSEDDDLSIFWRQYQDHRMGTRKRNDRTALKETELFETKVVPFFVGKHQKKDPTVWHDLIPDFHIYLRKLKLADRTQQKILWMLERFGTHMLFQRRMAFPFVVQVPSRGNNKQTPLKIRKTPDEILKFVKFFKTEYKDIDFKLFTLVGYFAALRPSELFALDKSDFITGDTAVSETKTYEGLKAKKLGTKLSVRIYKTLSDTENAQPEEITKTDYSRGTVNIWHPEAAKLIADLLKERPKGRLFPFSYGWLSKAWCDMVKPKLGLTPHDLRRTSCLYLGRTVRIEPTLLQEHMRHAEFETTLLYCREPSSSEKFTKSVQDLDDI